jgi:hypothetical protein
LVGKNPQKAWDLLWLAARAGSPLAQGQAMMYIVETGDFTCSTPAERRDWSLTCLKSTNDLGHNLLKKLDAVLCEKGLRAAICDHRTALARRTARRDFMPSFTEVVRDRLELPHWSLVSHFIPDLSAAISKADFVPLQTLLNTGVIAEQVREDLLQAMLEHAILSRQKQLMYFLFSHYSVDALRENPKTQCNALILAIFEDRNDALTWMLDLGVDRKLFGAHLPFGQVVCNSTWTMTNTYIQTCWTYWRDAGLRKLLNDSAPPVQGRLIPPPLVLSILARNDDSFAALLRYSVDINQRWGIWSILLLTVARCLPHFTVQLIEKGANIADCTADDAAMTIAHVLADAQAKNATNEDQLLWDMFGRAPEDRSGHLLTPSQAQRFTDNLLYAILKEAGVSFDIRNGTGILPIELAISSGKLWIANLLDATNEFDDSGTHRTFRDLRDIDGRTLLSYAIEDGDHLDAEELLGQGYDIDSTNILEDTALHEAARHSRLNNVIFSLHHGVNAWKKDLWGCTALLVAVERGHWAI